VFSFFKNPKVKSEKAPLDGVDLHLEEIPGAVETVDGFPRVNWAPVQRAADAYSAHPAIGQIWTELAAQWLGIIRRRIGERYEIYESEHLLLLSAQSPTTAREILKAGDAAFERLEAILQRPPESRGLGKHVVLMLGTRTIYYDYITYYYTNSDRERGMSAGVHITRGYRHTAINAVSPNCLRTLVHELAHDMVHDRPLPVWLNEGLAQFAEDMVPGYRQPLIDARQVRLHRRYWSWFGTNHFWDGRGFVWAPSQRLSYPLAEILFRNMTGDRVRRRSLANFLATAHRNDAGASACQNCFGCTPAELVKEFLGHGEWGPRIKDI
jgi:hypothetical protein